MFAAIIAACVEGWQELRIHKVRVLLSLIGVAVSVTALTSAMGVGVMAEQVVREAYEREGGKPATYRLSVYADTPLDIEAVRGTIDEVLARQNVTYASVTGLSLSFADDRSAAGELYGSVVDPAFAEMRAINPSAGRWFVPGDEENLSPPIVVNQEMLDMLGLSDAELPVSTTLPAEGDPTATIIGVAPVSMSGGMPSFYVLPQNAATLDPLLMTDVTTYDAEIWLPEEISEELALQISGSIGTELPSATVDVYRSDLFMDGGLPELEYVQYAMVGAAAIILVLAVLSLVNINVVTIQQRIREIGIRRSFGATGGRIFFSVVMESVVATALAGVVGVMLAIALLKSPLVYDWLSDQVASVPPFPVGVAFLGVLVSVATGVLAGLIPAVIATRVRIVDAIRA